MIKKILQVNYKIINFKKYYVYWKINLIFLYYKLVIYYINIKINLINLNYKKYIYKIKKTLYNYQIT